jgi:hypothetical protein
MIVFGTMGTKIAEYLNQKNICSKLMTRRVGGAICASASIYFVLLATLPCETVNQFIIALLVFASVRAAIYFSVSPIICEIDKTYQDTLFTLRYWLGILKMAS